MYNDPQDAFMADTLGLHMLTGYQSMAYPIYYPYPVVIHQNTYQGVPPLVALVGQLGRHTSVHPKGLVMINKPLVEKIVGYRDEAVPVLARFLKAQIESPLFNRLAVIEALYTAQRLAESDVLSVKKLYGITSRLNTISDPLILTYLGGLYEKLGEYESFGPTLSALVHRAVHQYPRYNPYANLMADAPESLGGAVLELLAKRTAEETVKQLKHEMNPNLFRRSV